MVGFVGPQRSANHFSVVEVKALFRRGYLGVGHCTFDGALKKVAGSLFRAIVLKNSVLN